MKNVLSNLFHSLHLETRLSNFPVRFSLGFILLQINLVMIFFLNTAFGATTNLSWDANTEPDLAGYKVYYGTSSGTYGAAINVGNQTSHILTGLSDNTYYFAVTAYDTAGNESEYSIEVSKTIATADTSPPLVSSIEANSISETDATISWTTDEPADTQVEYGTSTAYGSMTSLDSTLLSSHNKTLTGLMSETNYHYRVLSRDEAGNLTISGDNLLVTATPPDTNAPSISEISSDSATTSSVIILWTTNEPSDTQVEYGTTPSYGSITTLNNTLVSTHTQDLNDLSAATTYYFRVLSRDMAGNLATSGEQTFTTLLPPDTTPPVISGIIASNVGENSAIITWETDEAATSQVEYGLTDAYGSLSSHDATLLTGHSQGLSELSFAATYHYRVISTDLSGNTETSEDKTFITSEIPDTTGPVISNISTEDVNATSATITWDTDEAATSQVSYGTTDAYGTFSSTHTTLVTHHSLSLSDLSPSTIYHYQAISLDGSENVTHSGDNTFTTTGSGDTTGPAISNITIATGSTQATITWTTDEAATSQIEYGQTSAYESVTPKNDTLLFDHNQTLSELLENATYHFSVKSIDTNGNVSFSDDKTFETGQEGDGGEGEGEGNDEASDETPPGDILEFSAIGGNRQITLSWKNPPDLDFVGVRIRYRTDHFPEDMNDGTLLGDISGIPNEAITTSHVGLVDGITYYYLAASYDGNSNFQATVFASAKTSVLSTGSQDSDSEDKNSGGCGMVLPKGGNSSGPGDAAGMLTMIGIIILLLGKAGIRSSRNYPKTI